MQKYVNNFSAEEIGDTIKTKHRKTNMLTNEDKKRIVVISGERKK